jgi:hypothetical protein
MLNRYQPAATVQVVGLDQCSPVLLETPGQGLLFSGPLAKAGATDKCADLRRNVRGVRAGDRARQDHRPDDQPDRGGA